MSVWAVLPELSPAGEKNMPIDPKTTALLLIEYQNDFTSEGGALHDGVKSVMEATNMLANTLRVATEARGAGVTVMFAPISFAKGISGDHFGALRHPQGRCGFECICARNLGSGNR